LGESLAVVSATTGQWSHLCGYGRRLSLTAQSIIRDCPLPNREHPNRLPHRINGLVIKYQFRIRQIELEFVTSSLFVGAVVLIWKFATGDWNVAAAFGSLCVALMALGHQRGRTTAGTGVKNTKID
jgi:hypothetical protein